MKLLRITFILALVFSLGACKSSSKKESTNETAQKTETASEEIAINDFKPVTFTQVTSVSELGDGMFADFQTDKGSIVIQLTYKETPGTVANFVSLAEGTSTKVAEQYKGKPFYDGLKFHRVIAKFMIQGGDPKGNGSGNPGYKFADEFTKDKEGKLLLTHKGAGVFSMANSGPNTNGSQFFITHNATPHLDGKHTVFGQVVFGQDVVDAIAQDDLINKLVIIRNGSDAKDFDANKEFAAFEEKAAVLVKKQAAEKKKRALAAKAVIIEKGAYIAKNKATAKRFPSGLGMVVLDKGTGVKPEKNAKVNVNYAGFFEDGRLFDTSYADVAKQFNKYDERRDQANGYRPFPFDYNEQARSIPGFREAILNMTYGEKALIYLPSDIAYGKRGKGRQIPPNTDLVFEVELVDKK